MHRLVASIQTSVVRPLIFQGAPIYRNYAQLERLLRQRLSEAHAMLLAEPVGTADDRAIDWYSRADGDITRLVDLPPEAQAAAMDQLAKLVAEIDQLADELSASPALHIQAIGGALALTHTYPDDENLYVVGDQPVLTGWGFVPGTVNGRPETLTRFRHHHPQPFEPSRQSHQSPEILLANKKFSVVDLIPVLAFLLGLGLAAGLLLGVHSCTPKKAPLIDQLENELGRSDSLNNQILTLLSELDAKQRMCGPPQPPTQELQNSECRSPRIIIKVWDHNALDGDIVSISVNGHVVRRSLNLDTCGNKNKEPVGMSGPCVIPIDLSQMVQPGGTVQILVTALSEGKNPPNSAALKIIGECTAREQEWLLKTGQSASMGIIYR